MDRTSKLLSRQEAILKKYLESGGSGMFWEDLPADVKNDLRRVKNQETLDSDVARWLGDHKKWAAETRIRAFAVKVADDHPALAYDLLQLVEKQAGAQTRPIYDIAKEIRQDWKDVYFGAKPYLEAMADLDKVTDYYGADPAKSIVLYFLSNATRWKGPKAKAIKDELKKMVK